MQSFACLLYMSTLRPKPPFNPFHSSGSINVQSRLHNLTPAVRQQTFEAPIGEHGPLKQSTRRPNLSN